MGSSTPAVAVGCSGAETFGDMGDCGRAQPIQNTTKNRVRDTGPPGRLHLSCADHFGAGFYHGFDAIFGALIESTMGQRLRRIRWPSE